MKKFCLTLASAGVLATSAAHADLFGNITTWIGTGANEAAFEVDWQNGTANGALIWGYRWDGAATGEQMLDAIVATDPRLYAEVSGPTAFGTEVFGFGYHQSGDQNFLLSPTLTFNARHLAITDDVDVDDSRTAVTAGDEWQEGWFTAGFWSYYNSTDSRLTANSTDWDSTFGVSSRALGNGDVDGWVFDAGFAFPGPIPGVALDVAPVPEPSVWALLGAGGVMLLCLKRKCCPQE